MTRTGNRIGNGNEGQGDIIHAEGVRGDFLSSAPKARRASVAAGRAAVGLPCLGQAFDLVTKVLEVAGADV